MWRVRLKKKKRIYKRQGRKKEKCFEISSKYKNEDKYITGGEEKRRFHVFYSSYFELRNE